MPKIILIVFIFSCWSCTHSTTYDTSSPEMKIQQVLNSNKDSLVIGLIGGSITYGTGSSEWSHSWANVLSSLLEKELDKKIIIENLGIGATASDLGMYRIPDVLSRNPDLVIVEFAVNDSDIDSNTIVYNHEQIYLQLLKSKKACLALNLNIESGFTRAPIIDKVLQHYSIPKVRAKLTKGQFIDGVHPNDTGHFYIAEQITKTLKKIRQKNLLTYNYNQLSPIISPLLKHEKIVPETIYNQWNNVGKPGYYLKNLFQSKKAYDTLNIVFKGKDIALLSIAQNHEKGHNAILNIKIDQQEWLTINNYWTESWAKIKTTILAKDLDENSNHQITIITIPYITAKGDTINKFEIINFLVSSTINPNLEESKY